MRAYTVFPASLLAALAGAGGGDLAPRIDQALTAIGAVDRFELEATAVDAQVVRLDFGAPGRAWSMRVGTAESALLMACLERLL